MSEPFPPPPSSPSSLPPPPGPSAGAPEWAATTRPPLYVGGPVTGSPVAAAPTAGLRKATIVLFWCTAGSVVLLAFAALNRRSVWDGVRGGGGTRGDVDGADDVVAAAGALTVLLVIASTIVLSIWALRAAGNARNSGATDVSPGLACGGWYIPFGNLVVPFIQLRKVATHRHRPTTAVSVWQGLFIATYVVWAAFRSLGNSDLSEDVDELVTRLTAQTVLAFLLAVLFLAMAYVAMRAVRDVDGDTATPT
ncbi:MAG: DUF4328 domain-containing protein [Ilumatobacteraceae bacterium]